MSSNSEKFRYNTPYRSDAALLALKFGYDQPITETELNEIQDIQNELRSSVIRDIVPSGFLELTSKNFNGRSIIYEPVDTFNSILNSIAIAPAKAIVNGTIINIFGTYNAEDGEGYTLVNLGDPPLSGIREDLVYLEVWAEKVSSSDLFPKRGFVSGVTTHYKAVDSRVGNETSWRIVLRYNIRVAHDVDFNTFPDGLGYQHANSLSAIQAIADGSLSTATNLNLIFYPADASVFKDCSFYKDHNLYVAGRPDYTLVSDTIIGKYIFALPMFHVSRKNVQPYSLDNFNGSRTAIFKYGDITSATKGDLLNNIRPDKICYDIISPTDVIDLRKSVTLDIYNDYHLNKSLKQLMTGTLQSKCPEAIRRVQFGRESIDYSMHDGIILHTSFNDKTVVSDDINNLQSGEITSNELSYTPVYRDSVNGYGLYVDGRFSVSYDVSSLTANMGTLDIFMQPYWNGASDVIQNIFTINDINDNPMFVMYKNGYQLIVDTYLTAADATTDARVSQMIVDLTQTLIFAKQIYHLRFSWNSHPSIAKVLVYINGNIVGQIDYRGSSLIPSTLIFGNINDAVNYAGLQLPDTIIEEDDEPEEIVNEHNQLPLPGEQTLIPNELFITQDNKPIYTDQNINIFVNSSEFSEEEVTEEWLNQQNIISSDDTDTTISFSFQDIALSDVDTLSSDNGEEEDISLAQFITTVNNYWTNNDIEEDINNLDESSSTDNSNIEENYAPIIISRVLANDSLSTDEIVDIRAEEARKQLKIDQELYEIEQAKYEARKLIQDAQTALLENINYGFILEEVAVYKISKEVATSNGIYNYISNTFWPGLPNDFIANKALIYPSFNSIHNTYSDTLKFQHKIVQEIEGQSGVFTLVPPLGYDIYMEPIIYHPDGQINNLGELVTLPGSWKKVKANWVFDALDTTISRGIVLYSLATKNGCGGEDLPNEILAAGYVNTSSILEEVSFHRVNAIEPRKIAYLNPSKVSSEIDKAYDFSMQRNRYQAYARLLYYHISGTGTNVFEIPGHLYGYPVLNIISATNRNIANVQYIPDNINNPYHGFINSEGTFLVTLDDRVPYGDLIEFVIALGGTTFDYETQTKTLITNIYRTVLAQVEADGNRDTFIIPLGSNTGGILHAANSVLINILDETGEVSDQEYKYTAYVDNCMYPYRPIQKATGVNTNTWANQLADIEIEPTSWDTPFLKFTMSYTPSEGSIITVPVLVSYQPPQDKVLSIWYKYLPYQGILGKTTKKLKRITEWKYFITTLSSGNDSIHISEENVNSLNNIINRLPGGKSFASLATGEKIIFNTDLTNFMPKVINDNLKNKLKLVKEKVNNELTDDEFIEDEEINQSNNINLQIDEQYNSFEFYTWDDIRPYLKSDANYELRFIKDVVFSSIENNFDNAFFELDTTMDVYRITTGFQDEHLQYSFNSFKTYFPDTVFPICKYTGMATLVVDELGQVLLFVIGCLNNGIISNKFSKETILKPIFGDLFYLEGRPTTLFRS